MCRIGMSDTVANRPTALQIHLWPCHLLKVIVNQIKRLWQMTYGAVDVTRNFPRLNIQNFRYLNQKQLQGLSALNLCMIDDHGVVRLNRDGQHLIELIKQCFEKGVRSPLRTSDIKTLNRMCHALTPSQLATVRQFLIQDDPTHYDREKIMNDQIVSNYRTAAAAADGEAASKEYANEMCDIAINYREPAEKISWCHASTSTGLAPLLQLNEFEQDAFLLKVSPEKLVDLFNCCLKLHETCLVRAPESDQYSLSELKLLSLEHKLFAKVEAQMKSRESGDHAKAFFEQHFTKMTQLLQADGKHSQEKISAMLTLLPFNNMVAVLAHCTPLVKFAIYSFAERNAKEFGVPLKLHALYSLSHEQRVELLQQPKVTDQELMGYLHMIDGVGGYGQVYPVVVASALKVIIDRRLSGRFDPACWKQLKEMCSVDRSGGDLALRFATELQLAGYIRSIQRMP